MVMMINRNQWEHEWILREEDDDDDEISSSIEHNVQVDSMGDTSNEEPRPRQTRF